VAAYCPDTGDIIWLDFLQSVANEQAGRRPALVISPLAFNSLTGRCIACPITRRDLDWSFHVPLPDARRSAALSKPINCEAPRGSSADRVCKAPAGVLDEIRARLKPLLLL
jgi:mRNA interferase MazF